MVNFDKIRNCIRRNFRREIKDFLDSKEYFDTKEIALDGALVKTFMGQHFRKSLEKCLNQHGLFNFVIKIVEKENARGADLGIVMEIDLEHKKTIKWCLIQSKRENNGFKEIKRSQAIKMLSITNASFYNLYLDREILVTSAINILGLLNTPNFLSKSDDEKVTVLLSDLDSGAFIPFDKFIADYLFSCIVGEPLIIEQNKDGDAQEGEEENNPPDIESIIKDKIDAKIIMHTKITGKLGEIKK